METSSILLRMFLKFLNVLKILEAFQKTVKFSKFEANENWKFNNKTR